MDKEFLTAEEKLRYSRNTMLPEIGPEGQRTLRKTKILIVGCGALGSIASMYLAGSGAGKLGLLDFDTVDLSNLQRQLSFSTQDVGEPKATVLAKKIKALNPDVEVEVYNSIITAKNASEIILGYDIVLEGSDNPDTKQLVATVCRELDKPCVVGGISGVKGQVLTFIPGHAAYTDFFPEAARPGSFTPCALGGVLGPLPGVVGSLQAIEALKLAVGFGEPLIDAILLIDASSMQFTKLSI